MPKLTPLGEFSQVSVVGRPQPKTWADYRQGCLDTYGGGHRTDGMLEAFQHGMETVLNLLEAEFPPAEECKRAPALARSHESMREALDNLAQSACDIYMCGYSEERAKQLAKDHDAAMAVLAEAEKVSQ